ncbi:MAG: hypothetical protein OXU79_21185 [Gemmatimonadota bacterium]|nr:hypothetical protein [Gemmatimonadota bacterium]
MKTDECCADMATMAQFAPIFINKSAKKYRNFRTNSIKISYCIIAILLERFREDRGNALGIKLGLQDPKPHNRQEVQHVPGRRTENGYSGTEVAFAEAGDHRLASSVSLQYFTGIEYGVEMVESVSTREGAGFRLIL